MPTFEHDIELEISVAATWGALENQNEVFPKLFPELIASIELVEGDGGPGSVRLLKYGPIVPSGGYAKERIVSVDLDSHTIVAELIEGGFLEKLGFTKFEQTLKLISTGDNTSKMHFSYKVEGGSEETIAKVAEATKQATTKIFKTLEKHVNDNA